MAEGEGMKDFIGEWIIQALILRDFVLK